MSMEKIVERGVCLDQIYLLLNMPPKISISEIMEYLKGKSSSTISQNFGI